MGFFVRNPDTGDVIGQFPHLFPVSVALAYGLNGLSGARQAVAVLAILGLIAVYFVAARLLGRAAAAAAAVLLCINVIEIWFARYPNSEIVMQTLLYAAMLAFMRGLESQQRFFGPVAGALIGLQLFLRYDAVIAIGTFAAAAVLAWFNREYIGTRFVAVLCAASAAGLLYLAGPMRAYSEGLLGYTRDRGGWWLVAAAAIAALVCRRLARSEDLAARLRWLVPNMLAVSVAAAAFYTYFFRMPGGRLTSFDAGALRTFAWYVTPVGLLAAILGTVLLIRQAFWKAPVFFLTTAAYSFFFFYKARIVPEHFWMERRFLAATLPAVMIGLAALPGSLAALSAARASERRFGSVVPRVTATVAWIVVAAIGFGFWRASSPVRSHVEYSRSDPEARRTGGQVWRRRSRRRRVAQRVRHPCSRAAAGVHLRAERARSALAAPAEGDGRGLHGLGEDESTPMSIFWGAVEPIFS